MNAIADALVKAGKEELVHEAKQFKADTARRVHQLTELIRSVALPRRPRDPKSELAQLVAYRVSRDDLFKLYDQAFPRTKWVRTIREGSRRLHKVREMNPMFRQLCADGGEEYADMIRVLQYAWSDKASFEEALAVLS
jgi:hypothetical protein